MSIWDRVKRITPQKLTKHEEFLRKTVVTFECMTCGRRLAGSTLWSMGRCQCGVSDWVALKENK